MRLHGTPERSNIVTSQLASKAVTMYMKTLFLAASGVGAFQYMHSKDFRIGVDPDTGGLISIVHPNDNASMSWISGPDNTPWQPLGSLWGLGYTDVGTLHRVRWNNPRLRINNDSMSATYTLDGMTVDVTRKLNDQLNSLNECYIFTNTGNDALLLNSAGSQSLGIYTPFNDHYTSTEDVLEHRAHAHIWAFGGTSSWVKLTRMGLRGPHLGLVVMEGALQGYSVESRDTVTSSNTRGFFILHPSVPTLEPQESTQVCWSLFWHDDWDDFFTQGVQRSSQFVHVEASTWSPVVGETVNLTVSAGSGLTVSAEELEFKQAGKEGSYSAILQASSAGEQKITLTVNKDDTQTNSTILLNVVPDIDALVASRVRFITTKQQLSAEDKNKSIAGAYAVYDNEMDDIVRFDTASDRNTGRERVGMGVLVARWLLNNTDAEVEESLRIYYDYVNENLQDATGYVYDWPPGIRSSSVRLYDWPWVMQLHLVMAKLGNEATRSHDNYTATPSQRFLATVERFYTEPDATEYYAINIPIYEGLQYFNETGDTDAVIRLLELWGSHGRRIAQLGANYPSSEVNYEQSIVAPAAILLLELYRYTQDKYWLDAAQGHLDRLEAFGGQQPDYHLHEIAIRHWDGYWFGKYRMWGDTFPHYWSSLTAIAMHHYGKATGDELYMVRSEGILRGNMVLFSDNGRGYCAFIYPTTVNGRSAHLLDPYANDQDWALAHYLYLHGFE
ncbi:hypothetical protein BDW66DRAFT_169010 [Aspergillus desertorum]